MRLVLVLGADDQELLQRTPTAEGVVLEPEAAGGRGGPAGLGAELVGGPTVQLLVGPAGYETADGAHGGPRATEARAGAGAGRMRVRPALLNVEAGFGVVSHGDGQGLNQSHGPQGATQTPHTLKIDREKQKKIESQP